MGDGGLAVWPWYPIPTSSTRASRYEQSDGANRQSQPGRSFGTKANFCASCMSLISKSKMRKWEVSRMEESPRSKSHSGNVQEQVQASLSKSNHSRRRGGAFCFGDAEVRRSEDRGCGF